MKRFCPKCGTEVDDDSVQYCPNCGAALDGSDTAQAEQGHNVNVNQRSGSGCGWIVGALIVVLLIGLIYMVATGMFQNMFMQQQAASEAAAVPAPGVIQGEIQINGPDGGGGPPADLGSVEGTATVTTDDGGDQE